VDSLRVMKAISLLCCFLSSVVLASAAEETVVVPTIESASLFKNGLAVVRVSFPVNGPGVYRWDKVPRVVHGSFWVESDGRITVQSTTRMIEESAATETADGTLQKDLAGKEVTVTLKTAAGSAQPPVLAGKVWEIPPRMAVRSWDTDSIRSSFR
jgi:hypothetical protein